MKKVVFIFIFIFFAFTAKSQTFYDFCQKNGKSIAPSYDKVNCVQFMDKALKAFLKIENKCLSKFIYINYSMDVVKDALEKNKVDIIGGVSYGLVNCGMAEWVDFNDIKQGDIVQYWSTDGFINGHCGVYHGMDKFGNAILIGSHGDSKGYGYMNCYNTSMKCKFFVCRLK